MKTILLALLVLVAAGVTAPAYVLQYNSHTNAEHWNFLAPSSSVPTNSLNRTTHAIRYYLASDGYSTANKTAELNCIRTAIGQWQSLSNTVIKFEEVRLVNPPVDVNTSDNTNIIYWVKGTTLVNGGHSDISGALGETFVSFTTTSNEIRQADIVFNGDEYQWFTDFFDQNNLNLFVEDVALHELGHFLGLNHSPLGGATMFFGGDTGVNVQDGLSSDDIAGVRCLYGTNLANFGAIKGKVTKNGTSVIGAIVVAQDSVSSNDFAGTLTWTNGNYMMNALPPGTYRLRVCPLDPSGTRGVDSLCTGPDISASYNNAFTAFLVTTNQTATVVANSTNTVNFNVISNLQPFRITNIRMPSDSGSFSWAALPVVMTVGQSNYTIGVASSNLPTSGATLAITGDGLTLGAPTFKTNLNGSGENFISVAISIASNATPGLRAFIVQQGTNVACANGFLKIRPAVLDYNFDGLDDVFQRTYFPVFTATNAAPTADPDGDGMKNLAEYIAGTNPTNAASVFKLLSPTNSHSGTAVRWLSVAGKNYQVFSRTNLLSGSWQSNGTAVVATGTNAQYLDPNRTNGIRFYRVQVLP